MPVQANKQIGTILKDVFKGGKGSGNFGHSGRLGKHGGSGKVVVGKSEGLNSERWKGLGSKNFKMSQEDYNKIGSENFKSNKISDAEISSLDEYKSGYLEDINSNIRHSIKLEDTDVEITNALTDSINRSIVLKDTIVYRGATSRALATNDFDKKGLVFKDKGFLSTSSSPETANTFSKGSQTLFEIRVKKGSKMLPVDTKIKHKYNDEKEMLLGTNSKFKVIGTRKATWKRSLNDNLGIKVQNVIVIELL